MIRFIAYSVLALLIAACSAKPVKPKGAEIGERLSSEAYEELINKYTHSDQQYNGFYNTFQVHATMVNSNIQSAILQKESDALQWDDSTGLKEREKAFQEMSNQAKFFMSLYTPERKHNDLHKGASIWKIYLEFEGKRYEGRATHKNLKLIQLQQMFPYHNRWSKSYEVTFKVPMSVIETGKARLILTSSIGTAEFDYLPVTKK